MCECCWRRQYTTACLPCASGTWCGICQAKLWCQCGRRDAHARHCSANGYESVKLIEARAAEVLAAQREAK